MVGMSTETKTRLAAVARSGKTIYDLFDREGPMWLTADQLEEVLQAGLTKLDLSGLELRTRSKVVKEHVCKALGLPVPDAFAKEQPRFPCLDFDTYVQKANNLQIWNEDVSPLRRYVLIRLDQKDIVTRVKVITGEALALLEPTGTLTQKLQARVVAGKDPRELVTKEDTSLLRSCLSGTARLPRDARPTDVPKATALLSIAEVFHRLAPVVGARLVDRGRGQERNRGGDLHRLVTAALGYEVHADTGQFPDVLSQLLEVKLQTSPTIDLGLVSPDSTAPLDVPPIAGHKLRHCDVRYAIFCARMDGSHVEVTHLILSTGERFFTRFQKFQGKVVNKKLQIPLPAKFFD
jgi:hypothetical protein